MAVESGIFTHIQCPFSHGDQTMAEWIAGNQDRVTIVVNRALGSGRLLAGASPQQLFAQVTSVLTRGIVLTGTTRPEHLAESAAFFAAL